MARPIARVLQLLELLEASPRTRTTAELAERLGVDERTVRRYVGHLRELDVPVRSVRGRYGGVHLAAGTRMPPLMLTDEEALTTLLALQAAASAREPLAASAVLEATASKVRRVLPATVRARVEQAAGGGTATRDAEDAAAAVDAAGAAGAAGAVAGSDQDAPPLPLASLLLVLERAVRERRPVLLDHTGARGHRRAREVRPCGVAPRGGHWYLSAVDAASGEQRTFRLDRVVGAELALGRFDAAGELDPTRTGELVGAALADVPWQHEVVVHAQGAPEAVRRSLPAGLAALTLLPPAGSGAGARGEVGQPWVRVELRAERLDWLPGALLALPGAFTVERPQALRDLVQQQAQRLDAASATPERP